MNRWTLLCLLLGIATLVSAVDTALEARSGIATIRWKTGSQVEARNAVRSQYENLMTWQVMRTLLLAGGFGCSLKVWRSLKKT
jgi:hypothetical protein